MKTMQIVSKTRRYHVTRLTNGEYVVTFMEEGKSHVKIFPQEGNVSVADLDQLASQEWKSYPIQ